MLKGTAEICLTNVKTGEKERYVEHNIFTKALEYMHRPIGALKSAQDCTTDGYEPAYISLLGGLVLWDSNIEENREIITQPHGVKAVGCAVYGQTNTTTSSRRGSYNAAESVLTVTSAEKSMKFVYDFSTNQANGTIKCLSLTNWKAGWNGFGGDETAVDLRYSRNNYDESLFNSWTWGGRFEQDSSNELNRTFLLDPTADVFYQIVSVTTTAVTIAKRKANLHEKSVFQDAYHAHDLVESVSISLPATMSGANTYSFNYDKKADRLYILVAPSSSSIAASSTYYIIEIDVSNYTAAVHTLTNKLGLAISPSNTWMRVYDGYLYVLSIGTRYVRKISIEDGTAKSLALCNYWYVCNNSWSSCWYSGLLEAGGMLYLMGYKTINGSNQYRVVMLDPETEVSEVLGAGYMPAYLGYNNYVITAIKDNPLYFLHRNNNRVRLCLNTNYLATINNLSLPIEKTSDKTMKITYTIQEV